MQDNANGSTRFKRTTTIGHADVRRADPIDGHRSQSHERPSGPQWTLRARFVDSFHFVGPEIGYTKR